MKYSFVLAALAIIASATPISEQQCLEQFGFGGKNGGNGGAQTVTVTVTNSQAAAATQTVTVTTTAAGATQTNSNDGNNNNNDNGVDNSNAGNSNNNDNGVDNSNTNNGNNNNNAGNNGDIQSSLQLDPSIIGSNLASNGLGNGSETGQAPSLTSTNNFINFCVGKQITNGLQFSDGTTSCNPVPEGDIPAKANMINCKFTAPQNFGTIQSNTPFDVSLAVSNFQTGDFVNPNTNYFAAPQQLNAQGNIIGHSHVVIEPVQSLQDTTVLDPTKFAFFKGINSPAVNGVLTVSVDKGLPAGVYRIASINTAGNHQPALVPVAQHGSLDDMVYITVSDNVNNAAAADSAANATATDAAANATATDAAAAAATNATAAATDSVAASAATDSAAASAAATDSAVASAAATDSAVASAATNSAAGAAATDSAAAASGSDTVAAAATSSAASGSAAVASATASDAAAASQTAASGSGAKSDKNDKKDKKDKRTMRSRRFVTSRNA